MQTFDELPKELRVELLETLSAEAGNKAEELGLEAEYGDLMNLYSIVDKRNHAIIDGNAEVYQEYTALLFDENIGDC